MMDFSQYRSQLEGIRKALGEAGEALHIDHLREQISELSEEMNQPEFWNDLERSTKVNQKLGNLKNRVAHYEKLLSSADDVEVMMSLAQEENDEDMAGEIEGELAQLQEHTDQLTLETMMRGDYDDKPAVLSLHAGAGGTEAQDWTQMLYRMYTMWTDRHGYKYTLLDYQDGEEAGIKSATIKIEGDNAYGYLKSENGVHRLVRISPYDASGRRHTSFAAVEVMPEIAEDNSEIELRDDEIKMDVYRSSGAGGQKVNKTSSAVRLTHLPTGIVVSSQVERSHFQNLENCKSMLRAKLAEIKEREHLEKISDIKGVQQKIEWGSQIRSYVFMPYTLAKDTRTGYENSNIQAVMDGDIDGFINAYLAMKAEK